MRSFQENSKRAAYSDEEASHVLQWVVEGSKDLRLWHRAVWSANQLFVAPEHFCWVTPAHFLHVVETSWAPLTIPPAGQSLTCTDYILTWMWTVEVIWLTLTCFPLHKQQGCAGTVPSGCSGSSSEIDRCIRCRCAELWKWNLPPPTLPQRISSLGNLLLVWHTTASGS